MRRSQLFLDMPAHFRSENMAGIHKGLRVIYESAPQVPTTVDAPMNAISRNAICILLIAAPCSLRAQSIRLADSSTMEFNDPTYGVSFRFPSSWTYSVQPAFFAPPVITLPPDFNSDIIPLRGSVSTKKLAGVRSSPATSFQGLEFSYAVQEQTTPDDCRYLSLVASGPGTAIKDLVLNGETFHHGIGSWGASGRGASEEIDTASLGTSCLLFERTVHSLTGTPEDAPLQALTSQESARIQQPLRQIFASMKIDPALNSDPLPRVTLGKEFVDPQYGVRFRYPGSWSFATVQQFYGPEAVLTPTPANGATARAIVSTKSSPSDATLSEQILSSTSSLASRWNRVPKI